MLNNNNNSNQLNNEQFSNSYLCSIIDPGYIKFCMKKYSDRLLKYPIHNREEKCKIAQQILDALYEKLDSHGNRIITLEDLSRLKPTFALKLQSYQSKESAFITYKKPDNLYVSKKLDKKIKKKLERKLARKIQKGIILKYSKLSLFLYFINFLQKPF